MADLIDVRIAAAVARRLAGDAPPPPDVYRRLEDDLESSVDRAERLVAEVSGIPSPRPVRWEIVRRGDWAEANVRGMNTLIQPLVDRFGKRLDAVPAPARFVQRAVVSTEIGVMLGYVSRRVLGQYDLLVPEDADVPLWRARRNPTGGASLYFVGANMIDTCTKLRFVPEDFALWVAVHEVTHRFQFEGVPWLRERFFGLIRSYLATLEMDPKSFAKKLAEGGRRLVTRSVPEEERNAVYLFASEEQKAVLDQIQALMSVVEGHGNYVMDHIGASVIPSFEQMRATFDKRREQTNLIQRVINSAIGLEMKMRQYELGQRFCEAVVAQGGNEALGALWSSPDNLPSLDELRAPERWVSRVA
ncbi:MAG: zinc-dependent metalloprotease [Actinomycetota bacterium]